MKSKVIIKQLPSNETLFSLNPISIAYWINLPLDFMRLLVGPLFLIANTEDYKFVGIAVLVSCLSLFIEIIIIRIAIYTSKKIFFDIKFKEIDLQKINFNKLSLLFYSLFVLSFVLLASHTFGVLNWIMNPREGYQFHREGAGQFWAFGLTFLSVSFFLKMVQLKKYTNKKILLFIFYIISAYLFGSKGILIEYLIFFFTTLWLFKDKKIKFYIAIGVPFIASIVLYNLYLALNDYNFQSIAEYFDLYINSSNFYKEYFNGNFKLLYGKIFFTDYWALLPRALFPNKPYVYGIIHVNEYFFPGAAEETNTPAFGGPIAYFADFGILGVIFLTLFNLFTYIKYFFYFKLIHKFSEIQISKSFLLIILYLTFFAPGFLMLIPFPLNLIFILAILIIFIFFSYFKTKFSIENSLR